MNTKLLCRVLFAVLLLCTLILSSCGEDLGDVPSDSPDDGQDRPTASAEQPLASGESDAVQSLLPSEEQPSLTPSVLPSTTLHDEDLTPEQRAYRVILSYVEQKGGASGGSAQMPNGLTPSFLRSLSRSYDYQGGAVRNVYIGVMQGELCLFYDAKGFQCRVLFQNGGASAEVICHASTYRCTETLSRGKAMNPVFFNGTTEFFNGGPFSDYEPRYNMLTLLDKCDAILKEEGLDLSLKDLGYEHINAELFAIEYMY